MAARKIILLCFFALIIVSVSMISYAETSGSANYVLESTTQSSGGELANSSGYKSYIVSGTISGKLNSSNYANSVGFLQTWLLADGQSCGLASQCDGGYCCSNVCSSSSCPSGGGGISSSSSSSGGGGGGFSTYNGSGSSSAAESYNFSIAELEASLKVGEIKRYNVTIVNLGKGAGITLSASGEIENMSVLYPGYIQLYEGQNASFEIEFSPLGTGAFTGQIIAASSGFEKRLPVSAEVSSQFSLFDVKLDIPLADKRVPRGYDLRAQVSLLNIGTESSVNVNAVYIIKDLTGNIIYQSSENFDVERQKSYTKTMPVPKDADLGNYVAIVEILYSGSFAVSSEFFEVVSEVPESVLKGIVSSRLASIAMLLVILAITVLVLTRVVPPRKILGKK